MRFGLLGRKLGHSYSPEIHQALGDYEYRLYEKEPDEVESFVKEGGLDGFNVTIPYKKTVVPFLDELSPDAALSGTVNTVVRRADGSLYGDNTDLFGFDRLLERAGEPSFVGKKCLILGTGGTAETARTVLSRRGAGEIVNVSRSGENNYQNLGLHTDASLIVNTTPVGMYPDNGKMPLDPALFPDCRAVIDVIYNPERTALLLRAEELGIKAVGGLEMLVAQAVKSSMQFVPRTGLEEKIIPVTEGLKARMRNIVLIGMPGCGKSTAAAGLARRLGRESLDADAEIERRAGRPIPEIFAAEGEEYFRALETETLAELCKGSGRIIATGGGCVTREENYPLIRQNATVVWLVRELSDLPTDGRPLSRSGSLEEMFKKRRALYERFADLTVQSRATPEETVEAIIKEVCLK